MSAPLAVVAPGDVQILAIEEHDTRVGIGNQFVKTLVIGDLPVPDDLQPTSHDRTRMLTGIDPDLSFGKREVPMLIDPVVQEEGWRP